MTSHQKISDLVGGFTATIDNEDEFGGSAASLGDLDGAGPSTVAVAVGAAGDDDGSENRGAVYILFLNAAGTVLSHQKISSTTGGLAAGLETEDGFGSSLANLGDLDGAGPSVRALAVGTAGDDDGGTDKGAVYILFLGSTGTVLSQQKISDTAGSFTAPLVSLDEFGGSVASLGDLDGAGPSALAIAVGAIGDNGVGGANRGAAYVLFLNSAGSTLSWTKIGDQSGGIPVNQLINGDEFGSAVCGIGDLDGAGPSAGALVVGVIGEDDGGTNAGAIYVLFLNSAGSALSFQKVSETVGGFTENLASLDEFGGSIANLGSVDCAGPSIFALAVGAIGEDDGGANRGAIYILFMTQTGTCNSYQKISNLVGNFTATLDDGDEFGGAVAALGTDAGSTKLVTGASFDDDGGFDRGAVYFMVTEGCPVDVSTPPGAPRNTLGQTWPNPFNPRTRVPFSLVEAGRVEIDIWDAQGRRVRRLVEANFEPGDHTATWNGLDDGGRVLASGAYFFRMSVNGRAVTTREKAVLLK